MKPKKMLKLTVREIYGFVLWFAHSKPAIILAILFSLLLPAYVFYQAVVVPASSCDRNFPTGDTTELALTGPDQDSSLAVLQTVQTIGSLELEKAYLASLLKLSQQDSAYLNLNLADSLLRLDIKGVTVRVCPLSDIRVTRRLRCLNQSQLLHWVSRPFTGREDLSTIPKIRYMIKEAPKDTNEAALQSAKPIPSDSSSVYFTLYFNRHLTIEVEQSEPPFDEEEEVIDTYQDSRQSAIWRETMKAVLHGSSPEPEITIRVKVSKADARAIYRGLPVHPGLAMKLP